MELLMPSWMALALLLPLMGAAWTAAARHLVIARQRALLTAGLALFCSLAAWLTLGQNANGSSFGLDALNAPLLPLLSLLSFVVILATLKTRPKRFSFARTLLLEAGLMATLSARTPGLLILLLGLVALPQLQELHERNRSLRPFALHMGASMLLLTTGWLLSGWHVWGTTGYVLMALGIAIRAGLLPAHCWVLDLFDHGAFGTALLTFSPLIAVYAATRLLLPAAPEPVLLMLAGLSLFTALYAAAMSTIQLEARRFVAYFLLSHSALVLAGLALATELSMLAGLLLWLSLPLAMLGLGLTIRCLEARTGRLGLQNFRGFHSKVPTLAALFLISGLAAVGFPGTLGFLGLEMLTQAATQVNPVFGLLVIASSALNGIALLRVYSLVFLGTRQQTALPLQVRRVELAGLLILVLLLIGGALWPQPGIDNRRQAIAILQRARPNSSPQLTAIMSSPRPRP